jgi:GH18 family chitinase
MKAAGRFLSIVVSVLVLAGNAFALPFRVVGYFESWTNLEEYVPYDYLTHVNYAFLVPTSDGGLGSNDTAQIRNLVGFAHAKNVKVSISVGGWNDGDDSGLQAIASSPATRAVFINNLMAFVEANGLDGVDMDWEFPEGASNEYAALMSELSARLRAQGKLLTAAVWGWDAMGVPASVFPYLDFVNLMAYDNGTPHSTYNDAEDAIAYWKNRGLSKDKIVLGVPFYCREPYRSYEALVASDPSVPYKDEGGYENLNGCYYNSIPTIQKKTILASGQASGIMIWALSMDTDGSTSLLLAIHNSAAPLPKPPSFPTNLEIR